MNLSVLSRQFVTDMALTRLAAELEIGHFHNPRATGPESLIGLPDSMYFQISGTKVLD